MQRRKALMIFVVAAHMAFWLTIAYADALHMGHFNGIQGRVCLFFG